MPDRSVVMRWKGPISKFLQDETRVIDLEGALRSGKTTACLWKVFNSCQAHPGIQWLICRWSDGDTESKLKPPWRAILEQVGIVPQWHNDEHYDQLPNGSKVYIHGLKPSEQTLRYGKLRGHTLAGIYCDQTEELPHDFFLEFFGRLSQSGFPSQLILSPNPLGEDHWLAHEFPSSHNLPGRAYYSVSVYDNAHNLPAETIAGLEAAYPPGHAKHRSAVLGKRGLNVIGKPVYAGLFKREAHVGMATFNPFIPLLEAIDFGKHHPCIVWAQQPYEGGLHVLGGLMGQDLYLEDFIPIFVQYRSEWFPQIQSIQTCCDPAGSHDNSQGVRYNGLSILKQHAIVPRYKDNSNAPDVRLGMIERLGGHMRRRTRTGEAFLVNQEHFLRIGPEGPERWDFIADGCEAGYVWDEHFVSVGSKQVRKPKKDGWYEHGQNCLEYLELNFGSSQPTREEQLRRQGARVGSAWRRSAGPAAWMET